MTYILIADTYSLHLYDIIYLTLSHSRMQIKVLMVTFSVSTLTLHPQYFLILVVCACAETMLTHTLVLLLKTRIHINGV